MWIGNLMLLILNVPLIGIWISLLKIPRILLYPAIAVICVFGTYYVNNNWFVVWLLVPFAIMGYVFKRLGCEPAPMAIGFVIGSMLEEHLRRMLTINRGDWLVLFDSPISLTILIFGCIIVLFGIFFKRNIN
jgi:TctA family transporter